MARNLTVEVKTTDLPAFKNAVALLADAYEALASASSEGWDSFSPETRDEVSGVMQRIGELAP